MYRLQETSPLYSHLGNQAIGGSTAFDPVILACLPGLPGRVELINILRCLRREVMHARLTAVIPSQMHGLHDKIGWEIFECAQEGEES